MIRKSISMQNALTRMADLCARSEQCSFEVNEKLIKWGLPAPDRAKILATLCDNQFVDDSRYAAAYVTDKFRFSGWGRRKIAVMLRAKHIPAAYISEALGLIADDDYLAMAVKVMKTRCRGRLPESSEEVMKMVRFGVQRGFETDVLFKAIAQLRPAND
ncbi:MAG: RecX family transcriptional regulator [Muribaculum sp.]|nr:RecX family transcriptional regulator [Muribaculaceae bacterium]MCM1081677.1 RecX family transcriptional regulator [Muribaculum sp.]